MDGVVSYFSKLFDYPEEYREIIPSTYPLAAVINSDQVLGRIGAQDSVFDLGCGEGMVARALKERGHTGQRWGIDASQPMLSAARKQRLYHTLINDDIAAYNYPEFDWFTIISVLYHLSPENVEMLFDKLQPRKGVIVTIDHIPSDWSYPQWCYSMHDHENHPFFHEWKGVEKLYQGLGWTTNKGSLAVQASIYLLTS